MYMLYNFPLSLVLFVAGDALLLVWEHKIWHFVIVATKQGVYTIDFNYADIRKRRPCPPLRRSKDTRPPYPTSGPVIDEQSHFAIGAAWLIDPAFRLCCALSSMASSPFQRPSPLNGLCLVRCSFARPQQVACGTKQYLASLSIRSGLLIKPSFQRVRWALWGERRSGGPEHPPGSFAQGQTQATLTSVISQMGRNSPCRDGYFPKFGDGNYLFDLKGSFALDF